MLAKASELQGTRSASRYNQSAVTNWEPADCRARQHNEHKLVAYINSYNWSARFVFIESITICRVFNQNQQRGRQTYLPIDQLRDPHKQPSGRPTKCELEHTMDLLGFETLSHSVGDRMCQQSSQLPTPLSQTRPQQQQQQQQYQLLETTTNHSGPTFGRFIYLSIRLASFESPRLLLLTLPALSERPEDENKPEFINFLFYFQLAGFSISRTPFSKLSLSVLVSVNLIAPPHHKEAASPSPVKATRKCK